jgi:glycogen operon protein
MSEESPGFGDISPGSPLPLGARELAGGVNFALFSRHATGVRLELFNHAEDLVPARSIDLHPAQHNTGDIWHVRVSGVRSGQLYGYRVDGPYAPRDGHRFNAHRLLLDPFATALTRLPPWNFDMAREYEPTSNEPDPVASSRDNAASMPKCIVSAAAFEWGGVLPPRNPWSETIIYEAHVRGFTIHPTSGVEHPGTYRGLIEKLPYLQGLGVTAIELMPVQEFNSVTTSPTLLRGAQPHVNYWGYDPVVFCAPKASYCSVPGDGQQKREFQEMVLECHRAGI